MPFVKPFFIQNLLSRDTGKIFSVKSTPVE
uniref:Uncharacterized protein n=1 Tax=Anguilla anguilla TaxID=7936 RepID=A0A0E9SAP5_ANGAN